MKKILVISNIICLILGVVLGVMLPNERKVDQPKNRVGKPIVFPTAKAQAVGIKYAPMAPETMVPEATAEPTAEKEETEEPEATEEPEETEAPEEPEIWYTVMATAYTDAEEENGGFGAVDCRYGKPLIDGEHIAADLSFLPYGTRVYIEGLGERTVVDTASAKTLAKVNQMAEERGCDGWIDVFHGNRTEDMHEFGIQIMRIRIIELGRR